MPERVNFRAHIDHKGNQRTFIAFRKRVDKDKIKTGASGTLANQFANFVPLTPILPSSIENLNARNRVMERRCLQVFEYRRVGFDNNMSGGFEVLLQQRVDLMWMHHEVESDK